MSLVVWAMIGIAIWHFTVLLPDRFTGGIIGALLAALTGAVAAGYLLPSPGMPIDNPPGLAQALWPVPGAVIALALLYAHGALREPKTSTEPRQHSDEIDGAPPLHDAPVTRG